MYNFFKNSLSKVFFISFLILIISCGTGEEKTSTVIYENDEQQILFSSDRDGDWDIYQMGEKSFFAKKILNNGVYDFNPVDLALSKKVLFTSTFDEGNVIQKRIENDDGTFSMVDFETFQDDEIFISDYDGSALEALTDNSGCSDYGASWSSQSLKIVYSKNCDDSTSNSQIHLMDPDGSNSQRLTNLDGENWDPSWSPNGQKIVFSNKPKLIINNDRKCRHFKTIPGKLPIWLEANFRWLTKQPFDRVVLVRSERKRART